MRRPDRVGEDPRRFWIAVAGALLFVAAIAWYQARQSLGDHFTSCEQSQEDD